MKKYNTPIVFTIVFALVILVNYLSNALPLNGMNTSDLSDLYNSVITPAGPAFSIWGIIYASLLYFIIRLWWKYKEEDSSIQKMGKNILWLFVLNGVFNASWLVTWHYQLVPLSVLIMLGILSSLILIYRRMERYSWSWRFPWSLYLGWISVASIVNISVLLIYWDVNIGDPYIWTMIMTGVATILGIFMVVVKKDVWYAMVIVWALYFIARKHAGQETFYYYLWTLIVLLFIISIFRRKINIHKI